MNMRNLGDIALEKMYFPNETEAWIKCLRDENITKFRSLIKKERFRLPKKYKRLYMDTDSKLLLCIHYLRTQAPGFNQAEIDRSKKFIDIQQQIQDGIFNPEKKLH